MGTSIFGHWPDLVKLSARFGGFHPDRAAPCARTPGSWAVMGPDATARTSASALRRKCFSGIALRARMAVFRPPGRHCTPARAPCPARKPACPAEHSGNNHAGKHSVRNPARRPARDPSPQGPPASPEPALRGAAIPDPFRQTIDIRNKNSKKTARATENSANRRLTPLPGDHSVPPRIEETRAMTPIVILVGTWRMGR